MIHRVGDFMSNQVNRLPFKLNPLAEAIAYYCAVGFSFGEDDEL
jgi:hypothetical protein